MLAVDYTDREDIPFRQPCWKVCCSLKWLLVLTVFLLFFKGLCPIFPLPLPFWVPGMEAKERSPLGGSNVLWGVVRYVSRQIFKTRCFAFLGGGHVPVSILLLYLEFQFQYHLHVACCHYFHVLCRCSKACVACWNVTSRASGKTHLSHRLALNCKSCFYSKPLKLVALILFWKVHNNYAQ